MSYNHVVFTKENLDVYLRELAKEFRKLNGKTMPAEIILVGGAAMLANYGIRDMTYDIDAAIMASSAMKDAINHIGDRFGLANGWLNTDFTQTASYSHKLIERSVPYKTFSNIVHVRVVEREYLIAMKLMSGRQYKHDLSDVVGVLMWHEQNQKSITMGDIEKAVVDLYGNWERLPTDSVDFIKSVLDKQNYAELYDRIKSEEQHNRNVLLAVQQNYPEQVTEQSVEEILRLAAERTHEFDNGQAMR